MFEQGLEKEVESLKTAGFNQSSPGLKAIGYQEWFEYSSLEEIKAQIIHHTQKYAKKQYTYIRDIPGSQLIKFTSSPEDIDKVCDILKKRYSGQARI